MTPSLVSKPQFAIGAISPLNLYSDGIFSTHMHVDTISPFQNSKWEETLARFKRATIFHTADWARVLYQSYGFKPVYCLGSSNGSGEGLLPLLHVASRLTGRRGVSLPFTDQCAPLATSDFPVDLLVKHAIAYGGQQKWKYLELRGGDSFAQEQLPPSDAFYTHELALETDEKAVLTKFRSSTRRNIKKAQKAELEVTLSHSLPSVVAFYRLNCLTRRDHGLPPQPFVFFRNLHNLILANRKGFVILVYHRGEAVAGAVYLLHNDQCVYKFGASDKRFQHLRANNLVMWTAIQWCLRNQYRSLHFGRTELHHKGLLQFKRGWGTTEKEAFYYRYYYKTRRFEAPRAGIKSSYPWLQRLPISMLKIAGRILYRHVG